MLNIGQWTFPVWHTAMAQAIDQLSTIECGISADSLMEHAGVAVARVAFDWGAAKHPTVVLVGRGNNGGDGLVAARILKQRGANVHVFLMPGTQTSALFDAKLVAFIASGGTPEIWQPGALAAYSSQKIVVIDSLTGLGCKLPLRPELEGILREATALDKTSVIAVDLPSGIDADRGDQLPILPATVTVTFGAAKPCHVLMPTAAHCGTVIVEDIGFPAAALQACKEQPWLHEVRSEAVIGMDPWRDLARDANKYDRGHVLIIGGSEGKIGAPVLAGMAALRAGAGWVTVAVPQGKIPVDRPAPWELTIENMFDGTKIDATALKKFITARKVRSVVIGPGWMGQCLDSESWRVLAEAAENGMGLVIDAGALHGIFDRIVELNTSAKIVLTPHPGEWKKLWPGHKLSEPVDQKSRVDLQNQIPAKNLTLIYKGASPVICHDDQTLVCSSGSNILARAGTGDVLAGVIAAHLARGATGAFAFARSYVVLSQAGLRAALQRGHDAVIASDLIEEIGLAGRI